MKAVTFQGVETVELAEVGDPAILEPTDAIVRLRRAAICGSDMHVYHGRETGIDVGTIMGHEFTGELAEAGKEVHSFNKGDRVVSPFTTSCGSCFFCKKGLTARCTNGQLFGWVEGGKGLQGAHAEYVRVPLADTTLVHLPEELSWEEGNMLSDIFATGFYCAEQAEINEEGVYVVIGCGPVGQMAIKSAVFMGARKLYAVDCIPFRLKMAEAQGAIPVNFMETDPVNFIRDTTDGRGADGVMEAVGGYESMSTAFEILRPGGVLATVGVQAYKSFPFAPPDIYDKNVILKAGRCSVRHYLDRLIPLVQQQKVSLEDVITHTFSLDEGVEAYRVFDEEKDSALKVLLKP